MWNAVGTLVPVPTSGLRKFLRDKRKAAGFSQEEFARGIGWSRRSLIEWEMGRTATIKSSQLLRAIVLLKASIKEVLDVISAEEEHDDFADQIKDMPDEQLEELLALYQLLRDDPKSLNKWLGYGRALSDE